MSSPQLLALGDRHFVTLTTFRRSGVGVATTVWIARDGDDLIVTTPVDSGKVKRLRNDTRVTIAPSGRFGKAKPGAVPVEATVTEIATGPTAEATLKTIFLKKLGLEYRIFMAIEKRASKGTQPRALLRISDH